MNQTSIFKNICWLSIEGCDAALKNLFCGCHEYAAFILLICLTVVSFKLLLEVEAPLQLDKPVVILIRTRLNTTALSLLRAMTSYQCLIEVSAVFEFL